MGGISMMVVVGVVGVVVLVVVVWFSLMLCYTLLSKQLDVLRLLGKTINNMNDLISELLEDDEDEDDGDEDGEEEDEEEKSQVDRLIEDVMNPGKNKPKN